MHTDKRCGSAVGRPVRCASARVSAVSATLTRMTRLHITLALAIVALTACHPGPKIGSGPKPPDVGGTIAGIVTTDGNAPVVGRKVTVINTASGQRLEATTGANGGYTIKVPQGTYRIEVTLLQGEIVAKAPEETKVNESDLDPHRNIVITTGRPKG